MMHVKSNDRLMTINGAPIKWKWQHFPLCMYNMHIPTNMKFQLSRPLGKLSSINMCVHATRAMCGY